MRAEVVRVPVGDLHLSVHVAGEGPDVLLVHGFPDTGHVWRYQVPALVAAGYRVIVPDTRGCGESDMPRGVAAYGLDRLTADLVTILDHFRIAKVRLVGHDWGAVQAWALALAHPERVDRLVAMSVGHPAAYAGAGLGQKLKGWYILFLQLGPVAAALMKAFNWKFFRMLTACPEEMPAWRATLSRPGRLLAGINYYRANLGLILPRKWLRATVPVHGIYSTGDRFLTEGQMRATADYTDAGFTFDRIEGANHWLQLDAPEAVNALLIKYLA